MVAQLLPGSALTQKTDLCGAIGQILRHEEFERYLAVRLGVVAKVNKTHPAHPDSSLNVRCLKDFITICDHGASRVKRHAFLPDTPCGPWKAL